MTLQDIISKDPVLPEDKTIEFIENPEFGNFSEDTPLRVHHPSGRIEIHPTRFYKYPPEFQYFLLKWGYYKSTKNQWGKKRTDYECDQLATFDYIKKEFSKKHLLYNFIKSLKSNASAGNFKRVENLFNDLNKC